MKGRLGLIFIITVLTLGFAGLAYVEYQQWYQTCKGQCPEDDVCFKLCTGRGWCPYGGVR